MDAPNSSNPTNRHEERPSGIKVASADGAVIARAWLRAFRPVPQPHREADERRDGPEA